MKTFRTKLLYAYKFVSECLPIYAFYTLLFLERGVSVGGVAVLVALWSVFSIAFELPSGVLADRWSRRNMLALAALLQGLCFVVWFFAHSFLLFALGFLFWAISGAFSSGTEESLLYDNLKSDGREDDFAKIYGRARFFGSAGALVGIASAGVLAGFLSIEMLSLLSAGICLVCAALALLLREKNYYAERSEQESTRFLDTFREAAALFRGNARLLAAVLFLVLFAGLGGYLDEFDALIISDFGLGGLWVSGILTVRFVFVALGGLLAPAIGKRISSPRKLFLLSALASVLLGVFSLIWNQYALPLFGLAFLLMAIAEVLLIDAMQREITEEGRATVTSIYGVLENLAMILFCLVYALLTGVLTLQQTYVVISIYGIVGGVGFCVLNKRFFRK
jgi:MFS family permease